MPSPKVIKPPTLDDIKTEDKDLDLLPNSIIITGQSGAGKTTMAGTAFCDLSERLAMKPAELAKAERITLKGACWFLSDDRGLVSLSARKVAPEYVIDFRALIKKAEGNVDTALQWADSLIAQTREAGAHTFVHDTLSTFDALMERWYVHGDGCPLSDSGKQDTRGAWSLVGDRQFQIYQTATMLDMRLILLAHPVVNKIEEAAESKKATDFDKAKADSQGTPGENLIVPALSGQKFRTIIIPQSTISGWLRAEDRNGKRVRQWMPFGGEGSQGKNRYEGILDQIEPPDLLAQDKKILASCGAGE